MILSADDLYLSTMAFDDRYLILCACFLYTVRAKTFAPSYHTALKCLTYLSEDRRVAECRAFIVLSGNTDKIKSWLDLVDSGEV